MEIELDKEGSRLYFTSLNESISVFYTMEGSEFSQIELEYKFYKMTPNIESNICSIRKFICWNNYIYVVSKTDITLWSLITNGMKNKVSVENDGIFIYKKRIVFYNEDTIYLWNMTLSSIKKTFKTPDGSIISCLSINNDIVSCGTTSGKIIVWILKEDKPLFILDSETKIISVLNAFNYHFTATESKITRWEYEVNEQTKSIVIKNSSSIEINEKITFKQVEKSLYIISSGTIYQMNPQTLEKQVYTPKKINASKIANLVSNNYWMELTTLLPNKVIGEVKKKLREEKTCFKEENV